MKNKIFFATLISLLTFCFFNTARATLNIETGVAVPASCTVTDTDGITHNYPSTDSPNLYFAICALDAAIKNNAIFSVQLSNQFPSMGLFITTINNVAADPNSQYWAIYQKGQNEQNENLANSGIVLLPIVAGDTISFKLNDFSDNNLGDQVILHINSLIAPTPSPTPEPEVVPTTHGGGSGILANIQPTIPIIKPVFDIKKAFDFLISKQKENDSFGENLYTDWVALALSTTEDYQAQKDKLIKYFKGLETTDYQLTDYERHTIALMALDINPYNVNKENYIEKITRTFDGKQFGDPNEDNDDIFALIILQNTGYTKNDKIILDDLNFILSKQKENGSWDNSVDMTGAAIQSIMNIAEKNCFPLGSLSGLTSPALTLGPSVCESPQNKEFISAINKAEEYLKQNQKDDGGFGNVSATAWAMEGILSLGEKPEDWVKNTNSPLDYLTKNQDIDGGIKESDANNKIWETAYALSALSGKSWNQIMGKFGKPVLENPTLKKIETPTPPTKRLRSIEKIDPQNITASPINAITNNQKTELVKKQNWFRKLLNKIFGF